MDYSIQQHAVAGTSSKIVEVTCHSPLHVAQALELHHEVVGAA